jgi:hypothetical protein
MSQVVAGLEPSSFEEIILPSGRRVSVQKCRLTLKSWDGVPIKNTYNHKAVVDFDGKPLFAELAILRILQKSGWSGAWSDSYRNKYRIDLPEKEEPISLPVAQQKLVDAIKKKTGRRGGCWDVIAWKKREVKFVESKRSKKDELRPNQFLWLEASLDIGIPVESFLLAEWNLS